MGNSGSDNKKAIFAIPQLFPEITPKYGGKIKFPAPKKMANNAKPQIIMSVSFFRDINFLLYILKK